MFGWKVHSAPSSICLAICLNFFLSSFNYFHTLSDSIKVMSLAFLFSSTSLHETSFILGLKGGLKASGSSIIFFS